MSACVIKVQSDLQVDEQIASVEIDVLGLESKSRIGRIQTKDIDFRASGNFKDLQCNTGNN